MYIDYFIEKFKKNPEADALVWNGQVYKYKQVLNYLEKDLTFFRQELKKPSVVSIEGDFSPHSSAILLSLIELGCTVVPLSSSVAHKKEEFKKTAEVEACVILHDDDTFDFIRTGCEVQHPMLLPLLENNTPGLIIFSSGSTGKSKAILHNFVPLLDKYKQDRKCMRMITFLLFDHLGGINTLLYILSNAGFIVTLQSRRPEQVCQLIEKYKVEILPVSPTFINMLLLSEAYKKYDLSSLTLVTYGSEVMPQSTLTRFHELFPQIHMLQTYGLSETGALRTKSKSSDSLWIKLRDSKECQSRIVDGQLQLKGHSDMIGYLNAPSPFTEDGWLKTGDVVETDDTGEYFRILGRHSEIINVGGLKVYPIHVENILMQMDGVEDVAVSGEENLMTGQIVKAKIKLSTNETISAFKKRMRLFCRDQLQNFQIPQKIELVDHMLYNDRFKKIRRG